MINSLTGDLPMNTIGSSRIWEAGWNFENFLVLPVQCAKHDFTQSLDDTFLCSDMQLLFYDCAAQSHDGFTI